MKALTIRRAAALACTVLTLACSALAQRPEMDAASCTGALTIDRRELDASGAVTLSDLYRLFPPLRRSTVDGYSWQTWAGEGTPFAEAPRVFVDGAPIPLDLLGRDDIELLPIPLPTIRRLTFCPGPDPEAGAWFGPTLRFETLAATGLDTRASWQISNETGDPGPFRYTTPGQLNVDKSGPDTEFAVDYGGSGLGGQAHARVLRSYPTDPAITPRTAQATTQLTANQRIILAALRGYHGTGPRPHRIGLGGRYVSTLSFFETAGQELPLRRLDAYGSARGALAGPVDYRLAMHFERASDEDNRLDGFALDWQRRTVSIGLDGRASAGIRGGATLSRTDADGTGLADAGFTLGTAYGRVHRSLGAVESHTHVAVATAGSTFGVKAAQTIQRDGLGITLRYDRRIPEEDADHGYWRARGFTGLERPAVAYALLGAPRPHTTVAARLDARLSPASFLSLDGSANVQHVRGLFVERPDLTLTDDAVQATGLVEGIPNARGEAFSGWVQMSAGRGRLHGTLFYSLHTTLGGSEAFREAWHRVPRHRAGTALTVRPDSGFGVRASFEVQSATRWPGYAGLDGFTSPNGTVYTDGTPTLTLLDLAVEKGLWDRRATVELLFRNLLNAEERYHPLGAALDYWLYARVVFHLQGPLWVGSPME